MRTLFLPLVLGLAGLFTACGKEDDAPVAPVDPPASGGPHLILKFAFDSTQVRLNNLGQPATLAAGHAAQSPVFHGMSAHYVEFAPTMFTALGSGDVVYHAPETTAGGANAIDFGQSVVVGQGGTFLSVPLSDLAAGSYEWLRVSLAYQNYDVKFRYTDPTWGVFDLTGRLASFIGFNTYISSFAPQDQTIVVNDDKAQGFWAFETEYGVTQGASAGVTTVPNPINGTSPIPAGSCVVTGAFAEPLVITGDETEDVVITVSLSTNQSFEWSDNGDGIFEPLAGDAVTDMGVRGLIPIVE